MVYYFSMLPAGDFKTAVSIILRRAASDPRVLHLDLAEQGHRLLFCDSSDEVAEEQQKFAKYGVITPTLCSITINEHGIHINQGCVEDSQRDLERFVRWIINTFYPCRVYNSETAEDLSDSVANNPDILFR